MTAVHLMFFISYTIMPETTEQQPANTKPKQSAYLVCEGAQCTCIFGSTPVKLKVDSHKKAYINNNKLLATVKDVTFELPANPFGTCSKNSASNYACQPKFETWTKPYKDIEVEGNPVITDQSELKCTQFGGTISIEMHGQKQDVNESQANNIDRNMAMQVNPLASFVPLNTDTVKKVAVSLISGKLVDDPKYKSVTNQQIVAVKSENKNDHADIFVRPGQEVTFTASYKTGGTAALVSWKITGAKGPVHFLQHGPVYKTSFPETGKYTIEGYGTGGDHNLDVDTKITEDSKTHVKKTERRLDSKDCMLDIQVQANKLTGIRHVPSDNVISSIDKDKYLEAQVRVGVPVTFEPVYLMPPVQSEIDALILRIKDGAGNELKRCKGQSNIIFEAQNSAANYSVEAYFDNSEENPFTYKFRTAHNAVSVIAVTGMQTENTRIRPGTELTFSVSQSKFMNDYKVSQEVLNAELATIKWYESSDEPVATGTATYRKIYQREGTYVVTCAVKEKSAGWFNFKKNEEDDWNFEVINNYPTAIEQKTAGKAKVGKPVKFELKGIYEINYADTITIEWQLSGPETVSRIGTKEFLFVPRQNGIYTLTVIMNKRALKRPVTFECITCEIVNGWWTDSDGNMLTGEDDSAEPSNTIGSAGWKQEVVAAFQHVGLNGEEVKVEVWDKDSNGTVSVCKKDVTVPDTNNATRCFFTLDGKLKEKIQDRDRSPEGLLYFTVHAKNGLKIINNGMSLPKNGAYLEVNDKVRAKAYFSDNNDTKRYTTAALDTPVFVQVKTKNLIDEELELEVCKSIEWQVDKVLGNRTSFKVDKYGMASVKLPMDAIKTELPNTNDSVQVYVKIYNKKTGKEYYASSNAYVLTLYKTLATSPASIGTTKAFVVVDVSEGVKNDYKICECEARVRAFMRMLRVGEGTEGDKGYTTLFGKQQFSNFNHHPQKIITQSGYSSSAAGAYQIMGYTYKWLNGVKLTEKNKDSGIYEEYHDYIKKYSINDFSPANQDKLCVIILKHKRKGCLELIIKGEIEKALEDYGSYEWASLPPGRYDQPVQTMEKALQKFNEFLKSEKDEITDLKIEKEFLSGFGYSCKCVRELSNRKSSLWSNPLDYCERTYFNSLGIQKEQNGAFGPVRLNSDGTAKNHQGLDLFAVPGTACKACLDGEIVSYSNEGDDGYGNVLVLKVRGDDLRKAKNNYVLEFSSVEKIQGDNFDINAKEFYLRYAHLKSAVKTSGSVKSGELICYTGETGNANGVPNPHLHFEVAMKKSGNGTGLTNRYNPAFFIKLNTIKITSQTEEKNNRTK